MKTAILFPAILAGCLLQFAHAEGPRVDPRKIITKDTMWFNNSIVQASRKYPIQITIKTPETTKVFKGMFLILAHSAGKETRKNGVLTLSGGAVVRVGRGKPSSEKVINLNELNRVGEKGQQFKAEWISIYWCKMPSP